MDIPFDCCLYSKEALNRLVKYFQNQESKNYFGLDVLGINGKPLVVQIKINILIKEAKIQMDKEFTIYSKRLALELRLKGFKILRTGVNPNHPQFDTYIFENSHELQMAIKNQSKR